MDDDPRKDIQIGSKAEDSVLVTSSHNVIIQAGQVMLQAAQQAVQENRDPASMLRVLALLSSPVYDPRSPVRSPIPLDLRQEWHVLAEGVRQSRAPILLARLAPPTLDALRYALSPRAWEQGAFPHILHFSGHAWDGGLLLEDELGQMHPASTAEVRKALEGLPHPLDLVVLNGCESAADAQSVAQALLDGGLARAVVGHEKSVFDTEAMAFAARLYAELTGGFALKDAVDRAQKEITTHQVVLLGDEKLHFENLSGGEPLVDDRHPQGNLPSQSGHFLGRGRELVEISRALAHPPAALVLSGPPGIGKSSLVIETAHRNSWRFPGGVAYVAGPRPDEARSSTAEEMLAVLAEALGLERTEDLPQYTAAKPTLLLLDNLESLPSQEGGYLRDFLRRLGGESAAILALRPSHEGLEELPIARPLPLHCGLGVVEAARYALTLANQRRIPLTGEKAQLIARAVDGHPLLVEQLVAQARWRDLDELLEEVAKKQGDFADRIETVYAWSAARLDSAGLAAWKALLLFPAVCAPESLLRDAAGVGGPQKLREAALADFDPAGQLWRWHGTVAEYARGHWPLSQEERRARMIALLPAWSKWLKRQPVGKGTTLNRLDASRFNLDTLLGVCSSASYEEAWVFLDELDTRLPLPERTLTLRELVEMVWKTKLILLPAKETAERAKLLNNLGNALSNQGRRDEALCITEEAAEIYRGLAKANPQTFLPDLATTLSNLGIKLYNQGAREKALAAAQEAVDIQRKFDEKTNPKVFMPGLARSLNNLSAILSALGRKEKALDLAQESVAINKQLAESNPQIFLPDLAVSLYTLGLILSELNQRKEALDAVQKVVDIYKQLVWSNFQAFLPDLAASLNNLGGRLSDLGRWEEALAAAQESVNIRRRLVESNPPAFLPDLAASLNNLGKTLSSLRRGEEALAAAQECVNIHRRLAETNPQAFLPDLAMSLSNLSLGLSNLGQLREALAVVEEAVAIRRKLADANPQAFLPDLAASLNNQGLMLSALGRREQALEAAKEAADIRRKLAEANPQAFLPDLAASLGAYGSVLLALERHAEAAPAFAEGLQHPVPFYRDLPQAFTGLAHALRRNYVDACQKAKQEPDKDLLSQFD
jgi:tetratricopeptide (TPR) repeat protein